MRTESLVFVRVGSDLGQLRGDISGHRHAALEPGRAVEGVLEDGRALLVMVVGRGGSVGEAHDLRREDVLIVSRLGGDEVGHPAGRRLLHGEAVVCLVESAYCIFLRRQVHSEHLGKPLYVCDRFVLDLGGDFLGYMAPGDDVGQALVRS